MTQHDDEDQLDLDLDLDMDAGRREAAERIFARYTNPRDGLTVDGDPLPSRGQIHAIHMDGQVLELDDFETLEDLFDEPR